MTPGLDIAFFGSSLVSAYWNGAATYYRGIIHALARRGHRVTFYEPDAYDRQIHRDIADPDWARVFVYKPTEEGAWQALADGANADVIVKASGVGVFDELLEAAVPQIKRTDAVSIYWDVDAPATLGRIAADADDPMRKLIPEYDLVLTYGGGQPVIEAFRKLGARECIPVYNAVDPETHHPVAPDPRFDADLGFLGNRLPDRETRVERFFLETAALRPDLHFLLGGNGWQDKPMPGNVDYLGHIYTRDHNTFNCTPRAVLNVNRDSMAKNGWSPATRIFEAAGAGACLISDWWLGIEDFLEPEREVLVAHSAEEVAAHLDGLTREKARTMGEAARRRVLAEHTYSRRAEQVESILEGFDAARTAELAVRTSTVSTSGTDHVSGSGFGPPA
ncbi:CgeB family protein [Thiohalomonas denitrificans]|uniref:CgeB family protein n=1 Tax=Thiohalomonas denitrificans TaxID=415747 RepID=UPI0026EC8246|nr:glycosyltransferase [Thiohalomonas denitrificans]